MEPTSSSAATAADLVVDAPPVPGEPEVSGSWSMERYILCRQATLVDSIATRLTLELCRATERHSGSAERRMWWEVVALAVERVDS
jgi:hypothetical protein